MSITKITYTDKQQLNANASVNAVNKCQATDMNEIKTVVNTNADLQGDLASLDTTTKTDLVSAINEVNGKIKSTVITATITPSTSRGNSGYGEGTADISSLNITKILAIFFDGSSTHMLWGISSNSTTSLTYYGFRIAGTYGSAISANLHILYI